MVSSMTREISFNNAGQMIITDGGSVPNFCDVLVCDGVEYGIVQNVDLGTGQISVLPASSPGYAANSLLLRHSAYCAPTPEDYDKNVSRAALRALAAFPMHHR